MGMGAAMDPELLKKGAIPITRPLVL